MAIAFISDEVVTSSSDASSSSITIPSNCTLVVVIAGGWDNDDIFPGTLTINSVSVTQLQSHIADTQNKVMIGYVTSPSTGSQTLAWDWTGTGALSEGLIFIIAYFSGVDTSSPVVDSDKSLGTTDVTGLGSPASGDMMVGGSCSFDTAVTVTGSSQTSLSTPARFNNSFVRGAYKLAADTYDISGGDSANAHVAAVFRATTGTTLNPPLFTNAQTFFGPTLRFGLSVPLLTNVQTLFSPTVATVVQLQPPLLLNNQTFFTPTLRFTLVAPLLTNTQTFFPANAVFPGTWSDVNDSSANIWSLVDDSSGDTWFPTNDSSANLWIEI